MLGYVEMNFISICMCISILFRDLRGKEQKEQNARIFGERAFDRIIWATITILVLNTAAWVMQAYPVEWLYAGGVPVPGHRLHCRSSGESGLSFRVPGDGGLCV